MSGSGHHAFAGALLDAAHAAPAGLRTHNGSDPAQRFAVYRNNVVVSLVDAMAAKFPVVHALVGDEFFRATARQFILDHPPRSPVMAHFGQEFPAFVARFGPAQCLPYLADVARLEQARGEAYHAMDAAPVDETFFAALPPHEVESQRILLHPALRLVASRYAVVSVWAAHHGHGEIDAVDPDIPQWALVTRAAADVAVIGISQAAHDFIALLMKGEVLGGAAAMIAARHGVAALAPCFQTLIMNRCAIGIGALEGDAHDQHP